ncbi:CPBP family intramembrane metalloprotease [Pseudoxanthomonas sp. LjRoot143]|uniref:CPBP family intramembrane glutamic endopeptidase n=1 Tax=Pseudoxanthomonas sp. LjRoot143 TaxID=3342266 RepID=UPI003ECF42CE
MGIWKAGLSLVPDATSPAQRLLAGCVISTLALVLVVLALRRDRLDPSVLGLARMRDVLCGVLGGAALWLLTAVPMTALLLWLGVAEVRMVGDGFAALATLAILIPVVLLIEAIPEELVFRGYVQGSAARWLSPWLAVVAQAAFFLLFAWAIGATAAPGQWSFLPGFALILGGLRLMGGNLGWPIGFHAALMVATQWLLAHGHFVVHNAMTIQVLAFVALPSAVYGMVLSTHASKVKREPGEAVSLE